MDRREKESSVSTEGTKVGLFLENRSHQGCAIDCLHRRWAIGPDREATYFLETSRCNSQQFAIYPLVLLQITIPEYK